MEESVLHVLQYFSQYAYPPTIAEVHLFLNIKSGEREIKKTIDVLVKKNKVYILNDRITTYPKHFVIYSKKVKHSHILIQQSLPYLRYLKYIPTIQFLGISGSLSMYNTSKDGDIDIFIITKAHSLWLTRCIVLFYKYIVICMHYRIGSKFCFNLFFSEKGLKIEKKKQNEYIGHELLQLKPIFNKDYVYEHLLYQNQWIIKYFPNVKIKRILKMSKNVTKFDVLFKYIDAIVKIPQIWWLKRNGLQWKERHNQLWLIQE